MKRYLAPCCCLLMSTGGALAGESVDKTVAADPRGVVEIVNVRGEVTVEGWDRAETHVEGEIDDLATELRYTREGKITRIEVVVPEHDVTSGDGSTLSIRVPAASRVEIKGVSADTRVSKVGALEVRSVSGDLRVKDVPGELSIKSVSGDVTIDNSGGQAAIKSVSGDMKLALGSRALELSTVSGDLEVTLGEFDRLALNGVSGDLQLHGTLAPAGHVEIKSVSGDCALHLSGKVDARLSIRTGPGGEIVNDLSDAAPEEEFPAMQRLDATLGEGTGSIEISTVSGSILLSGE
jgi:DUF4097 and DUF4098 domain-containing protein YvlB